VHLPFSVIFLYEIETYRNKDCWVLLHLHVAVKGTVNVVVMYLIASRLSAKNMYTFFKKNNPGLFYLLS